MADLSCDFAGLHLRAPIWVGSQAPPHQNTPETCAKILKHYVEMGAAAVETHWISNLQDPPGEYPLRHYLTRYASFSAKDPFSKEGFMIIAPVKDNLGYLKHGLKLIEILKHTVDVPVIGNVSGPGSDAEGWAAHAKTLEEAGVDALELNVSCPMSAAELSEEQRVAIEKLDVPEAGPGILVGQQPELTEAITKAVVKKVSLPVITKMTPEIGYPQLLSVARAIKRGGARGVTAINAPVSIAPPDIYNNGKPRYFAVKQWSYGNAPGPWDRFIAYKFAAAIAMNVPGLDISAVGGIVDPEHVVEMLMLGAKSVQFSSGTIWRGAKLIRTTINFLNQYMDEQGFGSVKEIVGMGLKHIVPLDQVEFIDAVSEVDYKKCTACGICTDSICTAASLVNGKLKIDEQLCNGCGMCVMVCPYGAKSVRPRQV